MAQYFQTFTGDSVLKIQIDDEFRNLELKITANYSITAGGTFDVQFTGTTPCLAITNQYNVAVSLVSLSGNTWVWRISNFSQTESGIGSVAVSGRYFIFDQASDAFTAGAGIQIFNASSQLVYDSLKRYMNVETYGELTTQSGSQQFNYSLPVGRAFATASLSTTLGYVIQGFPPGPGPFYQTLNASSASVFRIRNNSFNAIHVQTSQVITPPNTVPYDPNSFYQKDGGKGQYLIIDVTGY